MLAFVILLWTSTVVLFHGIFTCNYCETSQMIFYLQFLAACLKWNSLVCVIFNVCRCSIQSSVSVNEQDMFYWDYWVSLLHQFPLYFVSIFLINFFFVCHDIADVLLLNVFSRIVVLGSYQWESLNSNMVSFHFCVVSNF